MVLSHPEAALCVTSISRMYFSACVQIFSPGRLQIMSPVAKSLGLGPIGSRGLEAAYQSLRSTIRVVKHTLTRRAKGFVPRSDASQEILLQRNTMEEYLMELILSRGNASSVSSVKALYDRVQLSVLTRILAKQHQIQLVGIE